MSETPGKVQLSIRVPADMVGDFDRIAATLDRDRTWVLLRALRRYLDDEGAEILQGAEGLAALDGGKGVDFDDVMAEADDIIAGAKAMRAARKAG